MRTRIIQTLKEVAERYNIELLYACESGSRAWGFPSPDSDYDVRFIYRRKADDYLSVLPVPDQMSFPITDELDLYGWDLKKVLQLLYKSNCTPFEWLQSPVIYLEKTGFRENLMKLFPEYFAPRTQLFHYLGIAKGAMDTMTDRQIKIKKLFYVLRPVLAAKWIAEKMHYPPMNIAPLLEVAPATIRLKTEQLIKEKETSNEGQLIQPDGELLAFIEENFSNLTGFASTLDKSQFDVKNLDKFFRSCIRE